jgi:MFS superfamily sulfate permease-like transporter
MALMATTFLLSILVDLEVGIVSSIVLSLLLVVHRSARVRLTILGRVRGSGAWAPLHEHPDAEDVLPGVLIVRVRENLDFANTAQLKGACL